MRKRNDFVVNDAYWIRILGISRKRLRYCGRKVLRHYCCIAYVAERMSRVQGVAHAKSSSKAVISGSFSDGENVSLFGGKAALADSCG